MGEAEEMGVPASLPSTPPTVLGPCCHTACTNLDGRDKMARSNEFWAVTKVVVYSLARFLPLSRLRAPGKVPRTGHKSGQALGPSCTRSMVGHAPSPQALPSPHPGRMGLWKAQLCSWLSLAQKSSLDPCDPPKEMGVLHLAPGTLCNTITWV